MGVRGLETYLERQCPQACHKVNIKELIDRYKHENATETVVIVVDGSSCLRHLYGNLDWLLGGQIKEFVNRIKSFVRAFDLLGATLILYFDGATVKRKRRVWISRRSEDVKRVYETFDIIKQNLLTEENDKRLFLLPPGIGTFARFIFKYECDCDVRTSVLECDEEVAAYARTNKCFAILGQDTDYVIAEGGEFYLSMKNLDVTTMQTLSYDRSAFAKTLQLPPWHLPLLATLCGNDVVSSDVLRVFHGRECQRDHQQYVPFALVVRSVANYIRRKHLDRIIQPHKLTFIAWDVFQDESAVALIKTSLRSYESNAEMPEIPDPDSDWGRILVQARDLHRSARVTQIYPIMCGEEYESCTSLEDYRLEDLPAAVQVLQPLRQRVYGILLAEKPAVQGVEEWCVQGGSVEQWNKNVPPIVPGEGLHPGLLAVWSDDTSLQDQRWELFVRSITPQLSAAALRSLPARLVVPAAILSYLRSKIPAQGSQYLLEWELDALAVQAVLLASTEPSDIIVQPPYNTRAIRLATVFMRAVSHVLLLLAACGFPVSMQEAMPWLYFDGKLFHATYKSLATLEPSPLQELCVNQAGVSLYEEYLQLRAAV